MESADLQTLRQSASKFAERHGDRLHRRQVRRSGAGYDVGLAQEMAALGWFSILVPEERDGLGLSVAELAVVAEELGKAVLGEPLVSIALSAGVLARVGNADLVSALLPAVLSGELLAPVAWQEAASSIDPFAITTELVDDAGRLRMRGTKTFVPAGGSADGFVVTARLRNGIALVWLPRDTDGLEVKPYWRVDGTAAASLTIDVSVNPDHVLAEDGAKALCLAIEDATVACAAEALGVMSATLEITLDYLRTREQFGKKIGSFQVLQHRAVDLFVQQELTRAVLAEAMEIFASPDRASERAAVARRLKARASAAAIQIGREAVQMHGAIGFTDDCDVGLYLKRSMVLSAWLGNAQDQRRSHAKSLVNTDKA